MSRAEQDDWEIHGETPTTDPEWMVEPSESYFIDRAHVFNNKIPKDHEVATVFKDKVEKVFSDNKIIIEVSAAAIGVAGVLYAANQLRRRRKK